MLVLLPPSETKRDGGEDGTSLDLGALSFPQLARPRRQALAALRSVSRSVAASMTALKLGPTQRFEIDRNRAISTSSVMPSIERYTGVLFDALDVNTLDAAARAFVSENVVVHSALFGLLRADDPIPAYRFSHDARVAGLTLRALWREVNASVLAAERGLVLDLRSESYVHLGPVAQGGYFVRVVTEGDGGARRALNHFNKHGKGDLVRALATSAPSLDSVEDLLGWAHAVGIRLDRGAPGELELVV
jgi:cytoplasmic iron level regulating protein YaaA (DUF328/UPF0246 family)